MIVSGPGGKRKPVDLVDPCAIVVQLPWKGFSTFPSNSKSDANKNGFDN